MSESKKPKNPQLAKVYTSIVDGKVETWVRIDDKLTKKKVVGRGGRPKGMTKRTIDRYKKVYRQFTVLQKKYTAKKKSELYELCSTKDYDGATYSRKTIRNIIEDKKYNLTPS